MNAERAQKGAQPYECRPTPSMLTPNQERLVTTLPKESAAVPNGDGHHVGGQPEVRVDFLLSGPGTSLRSGVPGPRRTRALSVREAQGLPCPERRVSV